MTVFSLCHHFAASGMGGMSINLAHLPHPGGIMDQGFKLLRCFEIVKGEMYRSQKAELKAGIHG